MKKELDEALCRDFPSLYRDRKKSMTETCMCWGFPGDGWEQVIRVLSAYIEAVVEGEREDSVRADRKAKQDFPADVYSKVTPEELEEKSKVTYAVADQVKEKFGTLRFYWTGNGLSDRASYKIYGAVSLAEWMSSVTCEECGRPGTLRRGGWLVTMCEECYSRKRK